MGQEVAELALAAGSWNLIGFVDDDPSLAGGEVLGIPVLGDRVWLAGRSLAVAVAVGSPAGRRRTWEAVRTSGDLTVPLLVHPTAHVGRACTLGDGSIVGAGAVLTTDVKGGRFVYVNTAATVSHNCRLADFTTVAPGAHLAGNVRVGEGADIGIGASIVQGIGVGGWSVVGAGATVIKDVDADTTVVGCPARPIARREAGWHM
jgi:sugar O-acyltransferase (sialic acid O-acetyltransferase NeuD family)